jgi:hypothetical protein
VTGSITTVFDYYTQYPVSFAYTTSDSTNPGSAAADAVGYCSFGNCELSVTPALNTPGAAQVWVDYGYSGNDFCPAYYFYFYGPASYQRYANNVGCVDPTVAYTTGSPLSVEYYDQYDLYYAYSLTAIGTFSPTAPSLSCTALGSP